MSTLCKLPWVSLTTDTNGDIKPCCISLELINKADGTAYNLGKDTIQDIFNSSSMVDMRQKMLDGVKVAGCDECYQSEKYSGSSSRTRWNDYYRDVTSNTTIVEPCIKYFDLRFGNLCNLSCRSCGPQASSQYEKEIHQMGASAAVPFSENLNSWYKTEVYDKNMEDQLSNIESLYMTGGEPTLIKQYLDLLSRLISIGRSREISLTVSSNMTNTLSRFYDLLKEFKSVTFFASIDGFGPMQEYLRYPSKWSVIDSTFKRLLNLGDNIIVCPSPVIQATNLNMCVELFDYFESYNRDAKKRIVNIFPINLMNPVHLDLVYLPLDFKVKSWENIQMWIDTRCEYQPLTFHSIIEGVKNKCNTCVSNTEVKDKIKEFIQFNTMFDKHRNVKLSEVNPDLWAEIQKIVT